MLPVGIEVVGTCAAEPIDANEAATLAEALAPATSIVCCPAPDKPGHLTVFAFGLSGSENPEVTVAQADSTVLMDGLNLQPARAHIAVSVDTGGRSSDSDATSSAEILRRLQECHILLGSAIVPPGDAANMTTVGAALAVSSGAGAGRPNKASSTGKESRTRGPTGHSGTTVQDSGGSLAILHKFADVRVLWPLTPAADYGGTALQV